MFQAYDNYFDWDLVPTTGFVEANPQRFGLVATFDPALELLDEDEGGYVNHPQDKGGPTNRGITLATFRRHIKNNASIADLKAITNEQVKVIYKRGFWDTVHGDELPSGVDYAVFDFSVNSGPSRALKYLQIALQRMGLYKGDIDGLIGPQTHKAVKAADARKLIDVLCDERLKFVRSLSNYPTFGKGWENRIAGVRKDAKALVGKTPIVVTGPTTTPVAPKSFIERLVEAIMLILNKG